jgi:hypothetical protein
MILHSPKHNFQAFQPEASEALKSQRESSWLTVSMTYALAEMASLGATTEQLNGARNFIQVLQNLWEKGEQQKRLPISSLETYDTDNLDELLKKLQTKKVSKK